MVPTRREIPPNQLSKMNHDLEQELKSALENYGRVRRFFYHLEYGQEGESPQEFLAFIQSLKGYEKTSGNDLQKIVPKIYHFLGKRVLRLQAEIHPGYAFRILPNPEGKSADDYEIVKTPKSERNRESTVPEFNPSHLKVLNEQVEALRTQNSVLRNEQQQLFNRFNKKSVLGFSLTGLFLVLSILGIVFYGTRILADSKINAKSIDALTARIKQVEGGLNNVQTGVGNLAERVDTMRDQLTNRLDAVNESLKGSPKPNP